MPNQQRAALSIAVSMLSRHVLALQERQDRNPAGELDKADLASLVRVTEVMLAVESARANVVLRALGKRIDKFSTEDLMRFFASIADERGVDGAN